MKTMMRAGIFFVIMSILTGVLYPLLITLIAQLFWPDQSRGSLIKDGEIVRGSALIAQEFTGHEYFWPRPSASLYSAFPSSGSNLGPTSRVLKEKIAERRNALASAHEVAAENVPESLVTTSASGIDPHISLKAALFQVPRIARARNLNENERARVEDLIKQNEYGALLASLRPSYVNVLLLNRALDEAFGKILR